jgi:hypothetical protein
MKIGRKHLKILGGILFLVAAVMTVLINNYDKTHQPDLPGYGKWMTYFVLITGFVLLMPWKKE